MPTAGEFCNRRVAIARSGETLHEVAARMREEHVGSVVVVDELDGRRVPIGMLTDRDIVVGVLARTDRRVDAVTVGDVMTTEPVTAREEEDLADLLKRMRSAGVRRVPIVDDAKALVGIVALDDLVEYVAEQLSGLAQLLSREQSAEKRARP
jgi:CBS domain-containing protein